LLNIDHFKRINDDFGHMAGDQVLEIFSRHGLAAIRATDRIGRYGGEEFLIGLVATSLDAALDPLERIRAEVAACDWSGIDRRLQVTVTIGVAAYRRGDSVKDLIMRADLALYRGKENGRDRIVFEDGGFAVASSADPATEMGSTRHADPGSSDGESIRTESAHLKARPPSISSDASALLS
jgi:diguanylate cyclase (GGDEF)-like protein